MRSLFITVAAALLTLQGYSKDPLPNLLSGRVIPDFNLPSADGTIFRSAELVNEKGMIIVFTCNHCPFAQLYTERFNALSLKYTNTGIPFIAINPMDSILYDSETISEMKKKADDARFQFPYLRDADQKIAKYFQATHTPEAFLLWKENKQWVIRYQGAIDDNGEHAEQANPYIEKAIEQLLQGKKVGQPFTKSFGCKIYYRQ